jgi:hypothetical protein
MCLSFAPFCKNLGAEKKNLPNLAFIFCLLPYLWYIPPLTEESLRMVYQRRLLLWPLNWEPEGEGSFGLMAHVVRNPYTARH